MVVLRRHLVFLGHNRCAILFVVCVVDEHIVLFRVNDGFDELTAMVAFALQNHDNDVHDFRAERRASHKNTLDDGGSKGLELCIGVLNELEGGVTKFIELRSDQVLEHIDGRETWNLITLVHRDSTLN